MSSASRRRPAAHGTVIRMAKNASTLSEGEVPWRWEFGSVVTLYHILHLLSEIYLTAQMNVKSLLNVVPEGCSETFLSFQCLFSTDLGRDRWWCLCVMGGQHERLSVKVDSTHKCPRLVPPVQWVERPAEAINRSSSMTQMLQNRNTDTLHSPVRMRFTVAL